MHVEIQIALNFIISYLYHKLPRRRVNLFGEELERALKERFQGHWYPREPTRGSAFRCVRTGLPVDPVLAQAARDSGVAIEDLQEALPEELAVWIDPGEVSYRIGERGVVKILYSESNGTTSSTHEEATPTFNPEAQSFCPSSATSSSAELCAAFNTLSLSRDPSPYGSLASLPSPSEPEVSPSSSTRSPKPLTFTTAAFAQTKFGSTKLKNSSKRGNRLSPTEFALYLKQRQQQQPPVYLSAAPMRPAPRPRSLSPSPYGHDSTPSSVTLLLPTTNGFLSPSPVGTPCPSPSPGNTVLPETSTSTPNIWSDYSVALQGKYGTSPLHLLVANS